MIELYFRDSLKTSSSSLYEKLMTLLLGLYYLYKKSPKQKKSPKRSFKALKMNQILPSRVGGTRWLPHVQRAINDVKMFLTFISLNMVLLWQLFYLYQVRVIMVFTVFRLLTDFVCLYTYEFWLSLCKIARSSVILLLPLFTYVVPVFKYCYSHSRNLWTVMRAGGLAL